MSENTAPPGGLDERSAEWHLEKFIEFTGMKQQVGEPSPHLAMVGHMAKDYPVRDRVWMLGCYAAVYCLPMAQVIWRQWSLDQVLSEGAETLQQWLTEHRSGTVTRRERRCIRTAAKLTRCLYGYAQWAAEEFPKLQVDVAGESAQDYYDRVWDSVETVPFIGRYIGIRLIEGLRRFCEIPATLYDVRSIGGWSPKKAMVYLYPEHTDQLLSKSKESDKITDQLAEDLLIKVQAQVPTTDYYVLAAMLCEYREAFEDHHQYPGWTIDQEPLMFDKVKVYWGDHLDDEEFWGARRALFPAEVLGECNGWRGTRWELTKTLRDHGYNWSDLYFDYTRTESSGAWSEPRTRRRPLQRTPAAP